MRKLIALCALGGLLLAACGSSGSSKTGAGAGGGATTTTASGGGSATTAGGGGGGEFSQLVAQAAKANVKITYQGSDGKPLTIAQDGKGKSLFQTDSSVYITDGTKTISCDGTTSTAKCTELPVSGAGSPMTAFLGAYAGLAQLNSSIYGSHVSSETIAGRDARCITFKASDYAGLAAIAGNSKGYDPTAQATICVDKDTGFLLKLESKSSTSTNEVFLATAVSTPSDADFNPPSTPETIPSAITIPGGGSITIPTIPGQ